MVIRETAFLFGSHIKPTSGSKVLCYDKGLFSTTKSQTFEESANCWDDVGEDNLNDYQEMSITLEAEIRNTEECLMLKQATRKRYCISNSLQASN
jgi:hypothetical protein